MTLAAFMHIADQLPNTERFPVLFVGHGNPMNAIAENSYVDGWKKLGGTLPRPSVILSISAHWLTEGTRVHMNAKPKTIHDFWGFPKELYDITYPCPGAPSHANATKELLEGVNVANDTDWGIDHGTWSVLARMYPDANIPVFQMSMDISRGHRGHYELGAMLRPLREKGVLIMGSGNLVHNLGKVLWEPDAKPFDWASAFDMQAKQLIENHDHQALIAYEKLGAEAALAIPTPDHYWPLLYALGAQHNDEGVSFPVEGIAHGSISMRVVKIG